MSLRRLVTVLGVSIVAVGVAAATPAQKAAKGAKATPAAGSGSAGSGSGSGSATDASGSGSAVQPIEDAPPSDMNGVNENPDAPKGTDTDHVDVAPVQKRPPGYPIEEALRPITLPQNMSEVSIAPHFESSPYAGADALRARYGITREVQLGLTYVFAGIYDDPTTVKKDYGLHPGKAFGLDVTVSLQSWLAVRVGVPIYIDPVAASILVGVPLKFILSDKLAIGGMDDLLNITVDKFAPSFYQERDNAVAAFNQTTGTGQSPGVIRFSAYGIYQLQPNLPLIGRFGIQDTLGVGDQNATVATFIRGGIDYSPRRYLDLGISIGFDDLSVLGSFGPQGYLALRI